MDGRFDEGCRGKWLASWGSHILSTCSHRLFCSKPSTLASRAEPLATVWRYHSPWWAPSRHPGSSLPQICQVAAYPELSHWPLLCFHCSSAWIPHQGSLPSLVWLSAQGHFSATFPSLPASQNNSPTDSPSIPFGLFYFSAHHCPTLNVFFYVLGGGFWPQGMWDLSSLTRDPMQPMQWPTTHAMTHNPCNGRWSLNYWTTREVPFHFLTVTNTRMNKNKLAFWVRKNGFAFWFSYWLDLWALVASSEKIR